MENNEQIQQVEVSLEEAKKMVTFGEALGRLERNRDFRTVVIDGYLKDEAVRLTGLTAAPNNNAAGREDVFAALRGIGELRQYFLARRAMAQQAAQDIKDLDDALGELRGEEA